MTIRLAHTGIRPISHAVAAALSCFAAGHAAAAALVLAQSPLFVTQNAVANVLMMMGNSNSMDESATGAAVGSMSPSSKSEISRAAVKSVITTYTGVINMGLLAYQQNASSLYALHNSEYDPSYNTSNYIAAQGTPTLGTTTAGSAIMTVASTAGLTVGNPVRITGAGTVNNTSCALTASNDLCTTIASIVGTTVTLGSPAGVSSSNTAVSTERNAKTKAFSVAVTAGNYIYYNVNLPFYASSSQGIGFCYSSSACTDPSHDFYGVASACTTREDPINGPWDSYSCFNTKTGSNAAADGIPGVAGATNATAGYSGSISGGAFSPTDSDLGQGITDFGKHLAWQYVSSAWFNNTSPGLGYLHIPIATLNAAQATKLNTKLATSQFASNQPTNAAYPLQNSGLSPLEGTVLTANNYFAGTLSAAAQGGPVGAPPNSCGKNFLIMLTDGLPSVDKLGNASSNVTTSLTNLQTQVSALYSSNAAVQTYVLGFALPYGVSPTQLNSIAAAGGTVQSYSASDTTTLNTAFSAIFTDIITKTAAASAVALNSQSINTGSALYQGKFTSGSWSGQLLSIPINPDGSLGTATWDAGSVINGLTPTSRVILSYKPSTALGIPFRWPANPNSPAATELDTSQSTALNTNAGQVVDGNGSARLDYLRGSAVNEGSAGLMFRARPISKLGDIVGSAPNYIAAPQFNYNESSYATFRATYQNRKVMVYVGANDGMMHGFDAGSGTETLAYVPSRVYTNLSLLTASPYTHHYFVDGSPNSADVYYADNSIHTVLVSGMGNGARGIFALNVTDPTKFSEANAASLVNFEFTDLNDPDVGYISDQVPIVKLNNGVWAAIFGNGYNSTGTGYATLFIVNIQTGALIKKITTSVGSAATPNALANPIAIDTDGNQTVDTVYAGDLQGNLWKFDISDPNPANWKLAYKLFASGQPITTTPEVGQHPNGGYLVYFGTGKYLETTDITTTNQNAIYALWDNGAAITSSTNLLVQTVTGVATYNGSTYRLTTKNPINWAVNQGWYINLPTTGERVITDSVLHSGRIIVTSMIPSSAVCSYGGTSWLMELSFLDGSMITSPVFDTNGDGILTATDVSTAGVQLGSIGSAPAIIRSTIIPPGSAPLEGKYINESSGTTSHVVESANPTASRRISWQQVH